MVSVMVCIPHNNAQPMVNIAKRAENGIIFIKCVSPQQSSSQDPGKADQSTKSQILLTITLHTTNKKLINTSIKVHIA